MRLHRVVFPLRRRDGLRRLRDHCPENDLDSSPAQQLNYVDYSAGPAVRRSRRLPDGSFEGVDSRDSLQVTGPWAAANADVPRGSP